MLFLRTGPVWQYCKDHYYYCTLTGPGMTSLAPVATHACGRPQALAWNMGTTGRSVERSDMLVESAVIAPRVWRNWWMGWVNELGG